MFFLLSDTGLGFLAIIGWCLISGFSRVYTSHVEQGLDPYFVGLFIFSLSAVFFFLLNCRRTSYLIGVVKKEWSSVLALNVSTLSSWFFLIYPLKYIEPSLVVAMALGLTPLGTLLLDLFMDSHGQIKQHDIIISLLFLLVTALIAYLIISGKTAAPPVLLFHEVISIIFCIIVSLGAAATNIYGKRLSMRGLSTMDLLSVRFFMLIVFSALMFLVSHASTVLTVGTVKHLLAVAVILVIIPMYLLFAGVRRLQPITVATLFPCMPVVAFFFEFGDARLHPNLWVALCLLAVLLLSFLGSFWRYHNEKL